MCSSDLVTIGPATDGGFFYDFDRPDGHFSEDDLAKIEAAMREIIKADLPFVRGEYTRDAMAAKLAFPKSKVIIVYGDGSFGLNGFEFEAMARQKIDVVGVIGNDAAWQQIRRGQVQIYGPDRAIACGLDYTR